MHPFDAGATAEFALSARLTPPECETADIVVAAPNDVSMPTKTNPLIRFLPVVTALATVAVMSVAAHSGTGAARNPAFMLFPVMMLASAVATAVSGFDRRRGELNAERAEYLSRLSALRALATNNAAAQRTAAMWCHPDPDTLWTLVGGPRMWERRSAADDFCHARIGIGPRRLATRLVAPTIESEHWVDPVTIGAMRRFLTAHSTVADLPLSIDCAAPVHVVGEKPRARALVRAMVCQLAVMHSPNSLSIAAVVTGESERDWDWLKWLPHNKHPRAADDVGPSRMVYHSWEAATTALPDVGVAGRVVVVDDRSVDGVTLSTLERYDEPSTAAVTRLHIGDNTLLAELSNGEAVHGRPDQMGYSAALTCARMLAGYRACDTDSTATSDASWSDLIGVSKVDAYVPADRWRGRRRRDRLRIPVGTTSEGEVVELDIKEAADNGMGPHGLCIGATGSGKSEFLRTVALGMITCHSPEMLNLVLIDFKGGATFAGLEPAPHVAAVITNLSDKAALVARLRDALTGELTRRQEILRAAGNLDGVRAYRQARRVQPELSPLPALFVIVDEFSELLSQHPDFADVFMAIGRLGRSLGMHLLLASQRLDEGRLRGLDSHLSYRVCLKTLSINESRIVLGTPDAYELPGTPGAAYLRVGTAELTRFQTAYVSGPCPRDSACPAVERIGPARGGLPVQVFTTQPVGAVTCIGDAMTESAGDRTVLQAMVERLSGQGPRAHEVWLPPLGESPVLGVVLADAAPARALTVPIGSVDRPFEQRRTPMTVDLSGSAGNVAVVGAPQSGKSTALRTLITALAATHEPRMVQFYCLDFGGGALTSLQSWPHVGSVAGRADTPLVRRTVAQIDAIMRSREALFRSHGIVSMTHYRELKAHRDPICDRFGDVFLVIDGWAGLHRDFEGLDSRVTTIAAEGLSFGVHVVLSASRWAEIRPALRDQIGTRIELRLGEPADSELDRRRAQLVPQGQPGRGLWHGGLDIIVALPRLDGDDSSSALAEASEHVGQMLRARGDGWTAPRIAVLPRLVEHDSVARPTDGGVVLGVEETELRTVAIDFAQHPHLVIIGDSECGKTSALRTLCRELSGATNAAQCLLFIADVRRSLLDVVQPESGRLGGYLASTDAMVDAIPRLVEQLRQRMPPLGATAAQLRNRSWWSGPEMYLVVDDFELVGNAALTPVVELLPYARDLGLHVLVARRSGGAARAMYEPLLAELRDAGCLTLLMSGSPDEGLTIGPVRQSAMPPGRGTLVTRRGRPHVVQVAWSPPP